MKQNRVVIFTVADPEIGLGHLYRCDALAQALVQIGTVAVLYIESHSGFDWLKSKNIVSNFSIQSWTKDPLLIRDLEVDTNLFIIDSYNVSSNVWEYFTNTDIKIAVFDDFGEKPYLPGFLINGSPRSKILKYSKNQDRHLLLGTDYQVLRPPFWNKIERKIGESINLVAVMLGGTDRLNASQKVVAIMKGVLPVETHIIVVGGEVEADDRIKHISFLSASGVRDLFKEADFLVSAAGQTVAEAVSTELPLVIIQTAENQDLNYRGWAEKGVCIKGGILKDDTFSKDFVAVMEKALDYKLRKKMFSNSKMLNLSDSTLWLAKQLLVEE